MYPKFFDGENLVGAHRHPIKLSDPSRLIYVPHVYGPGVKSMPYMMNDEFPENSDLVWQVPRLGIRSTITSVLYNHQLLTCHRAQEHFLFLRKAADSRRAATIFLNLGGPFESSSRDMQWQIWAIRYCMQHSISVFYDGLNPRSGIGGDAPASAIAYTVPAVGDKVRRNGNSIDSPV